MIKTRKMGRPNLANKPSRNVTFRLSEDEIKKVDAYAEK